MISFTQAATERLNDVIDPHENVRVAVMGGGCSGMSYSLTIGAETDEDDILITLDSVSIYVDPHSAGILEKTVIDYVKTLQTEGFVFNNQKANTTCGCGMSFS
jgi:iron-sulfur cluster assembly protein|tara:strand:- start:7251 stop:7559 length:309 start_codon:yes stop_codon:yes gene_type:complete